MLTKFQKLTMGRKPMVESRALITAKEADKPVKPFVPFNGTVLTIEAYNENLTFIVRMPKDKLVEFLLISVETNKAWATTLLRTILMMTPTMPLPDDAKVDLPRVLLNSNAREVKWTDDNWDTYEGRRQGSGVSNRGNWLDFSGTTVNPNGKGKTLDEICADGIAADADADEAKGPAVDICDGRDPFVGDVDDVVVLGTS
jgi:hypothetical protein